MSTQAGRGGAPPAPTPTGGALERPAAGEGATTDEPVLQLAGVAKQYGLTRALDGVDLTVRRGEMVGLIGHNGAGKSTLMRVVVGLTHPDSGTVAIGGEQAPADYSLQASRERGVRIAYQELSLAQDLRAFENVLIGAPSIAGWGWRRRSRTVLRSALDAVFPSNRIDVKEPVRRLSLAQQQMLEITQALLRVGGGFSLLILDEPTSALVPDQADNLFRHLEGLRRDGVSTVLISHKLHEVLAHTDRVVVMRDGKVVSEHPTAELDHERIVALMGGVARQGGATGGERDQGTGVDLLVAEDVRDRVLRGVDLRVRSGEVVGLSGLDGQGQQELLAHLWRHRRSSRGVHVHGGVAFVTGDRQTSGVFPLWDVGQNIGAGVMGQTSTFGVVHRDRERALVEDWMARLSVRGAAGSRIGDMSGGNQQKALIARALASQARLVLLDDPFRGVDVETKQQVYRLMREETTKGRSFLWFTTENAELVECDRVYVMAAGRVAAELAGQEISEESVISSSFEGV